MALFVLDDSLNFPPVHLSEPDGLLAMGGDLSPARLLAAYRHGIFPWYSNDIPLWWCPDPRFVLFPGALRVSSSMRTLLKRNHFEFTTDKAFPEVIHACKTVPRAGQDGTWITQEVERAYTRLHEMGYAHSAEVWHNGKLAGGLYGIRLGNVFFGESMFSRESNASKYAFIRYVELLKKEGVTLVDCQVYTPHLESLGAEMVPREWFVQEVERLSGFSGIS